MLFKNKECKKCGSLYDEAMECCPFCNEQDSEYKNKGVAKNNLWIPYIREIIVFATGWLGIQVIAVLLQILCGPFFSEYGVRERAFINYASYTFLFIALILLIFPFIKAIAKHMSKWQNYIYGIGYGVTLIAVGIIYNVIISSFVSIDNNANQTTAVEITQGYPIISLLFLGFIGPICEELTYRVGLFSFFKRINKYLPYLIVPVIFGLIHFDFTAIGTENIVNELITIPSYIIAGVILSIAYDHKGLSSSVTAHIINNVFSVILIIARIG